VQPHIDEQAATPLIHDPGLAGWPVILGAISGVRTRKQTLLTDRS